ncbi:MAG: PilZ domain-containing protein [Spirochaetaceae bacterium]|nr:PilZ domain-containing protein [Spirochaetaceae bacterium]MCF7947391.1 PilZ domain-containing protein [Spirochaetia bacterium]MCF7950327.1 PilZ domain-containing protein [Spirochaetaceae bacterium]
MEQVQEIIRMLFTRDLKTSPLETAIFLIVVLGFFAFLAVTGVIRRRKEQKRIRNFLNDKWDSLCRIYQLNADEIALLEDISAYLKNPEKKYLLLVNYQAFHDSLHAYSREHTLDKQLLESITAKTKMGKTEALMEELPVQRRKSTRKAVQVTGYVAPIEHSDAHIEARIYDLSRGGCKMENPNKRFFQGDDIKISFKLGEKEYRNIPAEVVRTSSFGKVLHVSFGHV